MLNSRNLTWFAMYNAAAILTDSGKNLVVHFGLSSSQRTMKDHLKKLLAAQFIIQDAINTLREFFFGIEMFDNSQMFTKLKFQRDGKSSLSTILASRTFVRPTIPLNVYDVEFPTEEVTMSYNN